MVESYSTARGSRQRVVPCLGKLNEAGGWGMQQAVQAAEGEPAVRIGEAEGAVLSQGLRIDLGDGSCLILTWFYGVRCSTLACRQYFGRCDTKRPMIKTAEFPPAQ